MVLAVFRPYLGGESKGVREEICYAIARGRIVLVYSTPEDKQDNSRNPFDNSVEVINNESMYYERISEVMKSLSKDM